MNRPGWILTSSLLLAACGPADGTDWTGDLADQSAQEGPRALACVTPPAQGDPAASSPVREGLERLNCHRDLMGLEPAFLDATLSAAAQAHADWIAETDEYGHHQSDPTHPLYTGFDAEERARSHGIDFDPSEQAIMEVVSYHSEGSDPRQSVDDWIDSVYHRAPLALPQLDRVGVGSAGLFDVMELLAPWEGDELQLAMYPGDGMRGVPRSFDSDKESPDPDPARGVVGYPVTLSLLVPDAGGGGNPYGLEVDPIFTALVGPGGEVPCDVLQPSTDDVLMRTIALLPHEPLAAGETYEVWMGIEMPQERLELTWSFTTAAQ